jgi:hypothetical protein
MKNKYKSSKYNWNSGNKGIYPFSPEGRKMLREMGKEKWINLFEVIQKKKQKLFKKLK